MRGRDWINLILPDELILEIFDHLDDKSSRDACSLVCKRWCSLERLSRDTIRIGASGRPDELVRILSRKFVNVKNLYVDERLSIPLPVESVSFVNRYRVCFVCDDSEGFGFSVELCFRLRCFLVRGVICDVICEFNLVGVVVLYVSELDFNGVSFEMIVNLM